MKTLIEISFTKSFCYDPEGKAPEVVERELNAEMTRILQSWDYRFRTHCPYCTGGFNDCCSDEDCGYCEGLGDAECDECSGEGFMYFTLGASGYAVRDV